MFVLKLQETELASRSEELMMKISDLTKQNEALQALVGDSETDRTMLSDSDKLISELKDALASAVTDNQAKSVELKALSSSVQSLTDQLDASKVVQSLTCLFSRVLIMLLVFVLIVQSRIQDTVLSIAESLQCCLLCEDESKKSKVGEKKK